MWFKILMAIMIVFLCGLSCGVVILKSSNIAMGAVADICAGENIFIVEEKKSITTIAPEIICDVYERELTFEENILNCIRPEAVLFNI